MMAASPQESGTARAGLRRVFANGVALVECLLALLILSVAVLGMSYVGAIGHQHLQFGDTMLRATRLAEHLMEEIVSRPFSGDGADRPSYSIDDYNGFQEAEGNIRDFTGELYPSKDQEFSRAVSVSPMSFSMTDLEGAVIPGKLIVVTVRDTHGNSWSLNQFIPEPGAL